MARLLHRYITQQLHFPVNGYLYYVQRMGSVDGGKTFWYCGYGKYCKTEEEAREYINKSIEEDKSNE